MADRKPRKPDFLVKTPCDGPPTSDGQRFVKWRRIGEAWHMGDGSISCRIDLPVQNCRVVLYPNTGEKEYDDKAE